MNDQPNEPANKSTEMMQIVAFTLSGEEYGLPISDVHEVIPLQKITPVPNSPESILGVINLRGKVIPVLDIDKEFHVNKEPTTVAQHIIITENEKGVLFGIQVDTVTEVLKVPSSAIKEAPKMVTNTIASDYIQGVIILESAAESGRMVLVLNIQSILVEQMATHNGTIQENKEVIAANP